MSRISASVIEDDGDLAALEPDWWELWRRMPAALPFQSPAWLLSWWRHFRPGALFTLAVHDPDRLVALAPGYIEDGPLGRRILPLGISLSDYLDILVDPSCSAPALKALAEAALARRDAWDVWELEDLPPDAAALALPLPQGCAEALTSAAACPVLSLRPGEPPRPQLPRAKQRHLQLARNRAARRGPLRVERAGEDTVAAALEHLIRLHGLRWQSRGEAGVLASPEVQAFQRDVAPRLRDAGLLRLYTVAINGEVAGAHYGLTHAGRTYVYLTGFDPAFRFESPGVILLGHVIEEAAAEGVCEIDFVRGQEAYKYEWGAVDRCTLKRSIRHGSHG